MSLNRSGSVLIWKNWNWNASKSGKNWKSLGSNVIRSVLNSIVLMSRNDF